MVRLTDEQLRELDRSADRHLTLVDPRSSATYILVPKSDYEKIEHDAAEEEDLRKFLAAAGKTVGKNLADEERRDGQSW